MLVHCLVKWSKVRSPIILGSAAELKQEVVRIVLALAVDKTLEKAPFINAPNENDIDSNYLLESSGEGRNYVHKTKDFRLWLIDYWFLVGASLLVIRSMFLEE